jgi:hypothetical protein
MFLIRLGFLFLFDYTIFLIAMLVAGCISELSCLFVCFCFGAARPPSV